MSRPCPCDGCDRPAPGDATICGACEADLRRALASVPEVVRELETTLARQTSRTASGKASVTPLPYDERASDAGVALHNTLFGWVRILSETEPGDDWPADTPSAMAAWLAARLERLVRHPAAEEAHGEILDAVRGAQRAVDRRPDRQFAGRCPGCDAALYAKPGAAMVGCRECDAEPVEVGRQLDGMRDRIRDQLAHPTGAARLLARLEIKAPESTIRRWAEQRRILAHGTDERGRNLYRIGDILDVVAEMGRSLPA